MDLIPIQFVCPCCGFEFGNDDDPGTAKGSAFEEYRDEWIKRGAPWFSPHLKPENWSVTKQWIGQAFDKIEGATSKHPIAGAHDST